MYNSRKRTKRVRPSPLYFTEKNYPAKSFKIRQSGGFNQQRRGAVRRRVHQVTNRGLLSNCYLATVT